MESDKKKNILIYIIVLINVILIVCTSISVFKSIKRTLNGEINTSNTNENLLSDYNEIKEFETGGEELKKEK